MLKAGDNVHGDIVGMGSYAFPRGTRMDFFSLLKSFDKFLYELASWLIFYPLTLWRTLRHPQSMMDYADTELDDSTDEQYADTLSPPLFLLLSIILSHAAEIAVVGENSIIANTRGLAGFISNDTNLILLRIALFSFFPLAMAVRLLRRQGTPLNRNSLRPPFYSQCYATGVFALLLGFASLLLSFRTGGVAVAGSLGIMLSLAWYGAVQTLWFSRHLRINKLPAIGHASIGIIEGLIATYFVALLFA